jgi:GntR family transcriptional regulator, arabinose operon transcriptional repressor
VPRSDSAYISIYNLLKRRIRTEALQKDQRLPTEAELAEEHGVSRVTVRKALDLLEHEGLIYRRQGAGSFVTPDRPGSGNGVDKRSLITLLIPFGVAQGGAIDIIRGANDFLGPAGYFLNIQISDHDPNRERELLKSCLDSGNAGTLYHPIIDSQNLDLLDMASIRGIPIVSIDRSYEALSIPVVMSDHRAGSHSVASYLIGMGHTRVGFVSDILINEASSARDRYLGYCSAFWEAGLEIREDWAKFQSAILEREQFADFYESEISSIEGTPGHETFYKRVLSELLDRPEPVTAIHAINDSVAIYLMRTAKKLGLRIPEDLSLVGFDDIRLATEVEPALTTVRQDYQKIGYEAARILVESGRAPAGARIVETIPTRLIERGTVCRIQTP